MLFVRCVLYLQPQGLRTTLHLASGTTKPHIEILPHAPSDLDSPALRSAPRTMLVSVHEDYWVVNVSRLPLSFKRVEASTINRCDADKIEPYHMSVCSCV